MSKTISILSNLIILPEYNNPQNNISKGLISRLLEAISSIFNKIFSIFISSNTEKTDLKKRIIIQEADQTVEIKNNSRTFKEILTDLTTLETEMRRYVRSRSIEHNKENYPSKYQEFKERAIEVLKGTEYLDTFNEIVNKSKIQKNENPVNALSKVVTSIKMQVALDERDIINNKQENLTLFDPNKKPSKKILKEAKTFEKKNKTALKIDNLINMFKKEKYSPLQDVNHADKLNYIGQILGNNLNKEFLDALNGITNEMDSNAHIKAALEVLQKKYRAHRVGFKQ